MPKLKTGTQRAVEAELRISIPVDLRTRYLEHRQSIDFIAQSYGISTATVVRWMDKYAIRRRPRGRPRKDGTIPEYAVDLR